MTVRDEFFPDDAPVFIRLGETIPRHVRIRPKEQKKLRDLGIKKLNPRQRQALRNYYELNQDPRKKSWPVSKVKKEAAVAAGYSEGGAIVTMDRLLSRKPIAAELDKAGVTDSKIAQVIAEGLESEHALKPGRKDPHAIIKFVSEANKIKDNYPEKKVKVTKDSRTMVVHFTAGNLQSFQKYRQMRGLDGPSDPDGS